MENIKKKIYSILYPFALKIVEECSKNASIDRRYVLENLKKEKRLTYRVGNETYLNYGLANLWQKFLGYEVIDLAIQKLADYEDKENNL